MGEKQGFLSGNMLKMLALFSMTVDHMGVIFFPGVVWLRYIGRLAFPLFAYMIAEGCAHTRNLKRYFLTILCMGLAMQVVVLLFLHSWRQEIFITFSLSILLICLYRHGRGKRQWQGYLPFCFALAVVFFLTVVLPELLPKNLFWIDYGFFGVLLPLFAYIPEDRKTKFFFFAVGNVAVSLYFGYGQWYSLLALIPLAFYNGKRGRFRLKWMFYLYYPLHLVILYGISLFLPHFVH